MGNWFYIGFVTIGLLILGGKFPRIALAVAALIFFGAVLMNVNTFTSLMKPKEAK